jgi:hypothetical protein
MRVGAEASATACSLLLLLLLPRRD